MAIPEDVEEELEKAHGRAITVFYGLSDPDTPSLGMIGITGKDNADSKWANALYWARNLKSIAELVDKKLSEMQKEE